MQEICTKEWRGHPYALDQGADLGILEPLHYIYKNASTPRRVHSFVVKGMPFPASLLS